MRGDHFSRRLVTSRSEFMSAMVGRFPPDELKIWNWTVLGNIENCWGIPEGWASYIILDRQRMPEMGLLRVFWVSTAAMWQEMKEFFLSRLSATHTENDVAWSSLVGLGCMRWYPVGLKFCCTMTHPALTWKNCFVVLLSGHVLSASQGLDCVPAEQAAATRVARGWANIGYSAAFTSCPWRLASWQVVHTVYSCTWCPWSNPIEFRLRVKWCQRFFSCGRKRISPTCSQKDTTGSSFPHQADIIGVRNLFCTQGQQDPWIMGYSILLHNMKIMKGVKKLVAR
jgi:hypothetical protein